MTAAARTARDTMPPELLGVDTPMLTDLLRVGGAAGASIYAILWLVKRGDRLQRDNIDELKKQRDEWRERAEKAEQELINLRDDLARERRLRRLCEKSHNEEGTHE